MASRHVPASAVVLAALAAIACSKEPERVVVADAAPDVAPPAPAPSTEVTVVDLTEPTPPKRRGWNAAKIDWQNIDTGLSRAKIERKPICLVFHTTWCPHCRAYSHVFDDERIVERARDFIMIRVDADTDPVMDKRYSPDGRYVPRTYFLSADGVVDASIHAPQPKHRFNYDDDDPSPLLASMDVAARKLSKR